ncbi:MAG: gluconate transporter [Saprospiraceae bacterium]|uniref:Gluconate transporter n=1 Tax=Candidatus Opimibacter skivensis TaxID=2982028 RepID=A0A9D7SVZ9_9BACT|nr:gluconate transporter [Candidatus Opimibacter skivensis]
MNTELLLAVLAGIALLLVLILFVRLHAFLALLITSVTVGLLAGMNGAEIADTIQKGMASTLGFVATVVGLGAMFGSILEASGGAEAIAKSLISTNQTQRAPWTMMITGYIVSIPVFFDVGFIILIPLIYGLQRRSGKSILAFAIPLLAGLAVTHAFVPPTPGPVAVAGILGADLGTVILVGLLTGFPAAVVGGILWGKFISRRIFIAAPEIKDEENEMNVPPVWMFLMLIIIPLALIIANTIIERLVKSGVQNIDLLNKIFALIGHPFAALIIANLLAWYLLGIRRGMSREKLLEITTRSLTPVGMIILLIGAGGVFKQVLVDTGSGEMLARSMTSLGIPAFLFAFITAAIIRILQGSATVAMITSAGLTAPLLIGLGLREVQLASIVIAIASGATFMSHVNDSGFWLVKQYLGLTEKQTFHSWTVMTMLVGITGLIGAGLIYYLV